MAAASSAPDHDRLTRTMVFPASLSADGPPIPPPTTAPLPEVEGYSILGELGKGGMGVVYKAEQTAVRRVVALKLIRGCPDDEARERFRTEAHAVAALQHPNVVQVFEVGEHRGVPFISLEFCAGGSLEGRLQASPLPPAEAAGLVETLARAVHHAHERGVLHRDLKPANVLLSEDGTPKVTDFGLARKLDEAGLTQTGDVMGSPPYMAPEQAWGKTKEIGRPADVYALGAILYECLTGRPPFKAATSLDTLLQVRYDDPVPPRQLQSKTPRDLETICLKCLQKDAARRYDGGAALAEDLRRYQAGEPIRARSAGRLERTWRWGRRNPKDAALIAAGLLAVVLGVVAYLWIAGARQAAEQDRRDRQARATTQAERDVAEADLLWDQAKAAPVADLLPWEKALAAAGRAKEATDANAVEEPTRRHVEKTWAGVAAEKQQAETRAAAATRDEHMKADLQKLTLSQLQLETKEKGGLQEESFDLTHANAEYERVFRDDYGIDLARPEEAEARIRASAIRPQLVEALDAWIPLRPDEQARRRLVDLVNRLSEPDDFQRELREALVKPDNDRLRKLAKQAPSSLSPKTLFELAISLYENKDFEEAETLFRQGQQRYPTEYAFNFFMGACLQKLGPPRSLEAVRFWTAAVALQPDSANAHFALGESLLPLGLYDAAIAEWRTAQRLDPKHGGVFHNVGAILATQGKLDAAVAELRQAIQDDPRDLGAYSNIGLALRLQGKPEEAVAACRAALQITPDIAGADVLLADAHRLLAEALKDSGDYAGAMSEFRECLNLYPLTTSSHDDAQNEILRLENWIQYDRYLDDVLAGKIKPANGSTAASMGLMFLTKKRPAAAARYFTDAFAADQKFADYYRVEAARAAALAGCGRGVDVGELTDPKRADWRKQAREWLRDELAARSRKAAEGGPQQQLNTARELRIWQCHVDFAGVRDEAELKKLPEDEQAAWRQFWADVAAAVERAELR